MPLIYEQHIDSNTKLGLWEITEAETFFKIPEVEGAFISHPARRIQHLAGRYLLKTLEPALQLNNLILSESGQPLVSNGSFYFSISHGGKMAAVVVSSKGPLGLDIEQIKPRIERMASKFVREDEMDQLAHADWDNASRVTWVWTVKEAVFKWYGRGGVDFKKDICIQQFTKEGNNVHAYIQWLKSPAVILESRSFLLHDVWVTWILDPSILGE